MKPDTPPQASEVTADEGRRGFLASLAAIAVGAAATLIPTAAGLFAFLNPLGKSGGDALRLQITSLDALPDDGMPRRFSVVTARTDAWSQLPAEPIGAVYLRRVGEDVTAHSAICPHAGCFVEFRDGDSLYQCPCHDSQFEADGSRIRPEECPAPRGLDSLAVEVDDSGAVWVRYETFRAGTAEKIAES